MTDRYTVSENPFGYEADVGTARLRYALTDNRPDKISLWSPRARAFELSEAKGKYKRPFRHICYGPHKEDLQALAAAMNYAEAMTSPILGRLFSQPEKPNGL